MVQLEWPPIWNQTFERSPAIAGLTWRCSLGDVGPDNRSASRYVLWNGVRLCSSIPFPVYPRQGFGFAYEPGDYERGTLL
jgi:hypothetical protein